MSEVRNHPLREKLLLLLLSLLLLSQRELCLQLGVTQLSLSSITPHALKSAEELLLSLRAPIPHLQPAKKVVPNQSLEMMLLLPGTKTDLRPATTANSQSVSALEIGVIGLLLRESIWMCVKRVLVVL